MKKVMLILMLVVVLGCKEKPQDAGGVVVGEWGVAVPIEGLAFESTANGATIDIDTEAPEFVIEASETESFTIDANDFLISITDWDMPTNISICLNDVEVLFEVKDGKFDVVYDPNKCTESAKAFFICFEIYFKNMIRKVNENE